MLVNTSFSPASFQSPQLTSGRQSSTAPANDAARSLSTLEEKALENIARHLPGMTVGGLKRLNSEDFTPEKVADRITQFVQTGLAGARARGASEAQVEALRQSAVKGVERGVREARDILSGLNLLSGKIAEQVDETERLTLDGLARLAAGQVDNSTMLQTAMSVSERYQRAESLEFNLLTQEGDRVTLKFARAVDMQSQFAMSLQTTNDGQQARALSSVSRYEQAGYLFSVEGNLNSDERSAIENLVQDLDRLANEFFNGDVQKAFSMLPELRFDGSQLASMELNMQRVERYNLAQRYEQTQQLEEPEQSKPGRRLGQLMQEMNQRFNESVLDFIDQYQKNAELIMQNLVQQDSRFKEASDSQQDVLRNNLQRLFQAVNPLVDRG